MTGLPLVRQAAEDEGAVWARGDLRSSAVDRTAVGGSKRQHLTMSMTLRSREVHTAARSVPWSWSLAARALLMIAQRMAARICRSQPRARVRSAMRVLSNSALIASARRGRRSPCSRPPRESTCRGVLKSGVRGQARKRTPAWGFTSVERPDSTPSGAWSADGTAEGRMLTCDVGDSGNWWTQRICRCKALRRAE